MKIISVINYKGGVGKTTLTANLAAFLAKHGKKILLVDMDAQCNLTFSFIPPERWISAMRDKKTLKEWFAGMRGVGGCDLSSLIIGNLAVNQYTGAGAISLIPSHLDLLDVDLDLAHYTAETVRADSCQKRLEIYGMLHRHLHVVGEKYDLVMIDCPPNFNIVTQIAVVASDRILIPAIPTYLSTVGIRHLIRKRGKLKEDYNRWLKEDDQSNDWLGPKIAAIVLTMTRKNNAGNFIPGFQESFEKLRELVYSRDSQEGDGGLSKTEGASLIDGIEYNGKAFGTQDVVPFYLRKWDQRDATRHRIAQGIEGVARQFCSSIKIDWLTKEERERQNKESKAWLEAWLEDNE
jgi:chromosome partitioning protein